MMLPPAALAFLRKYGVYLGIMVVGMIILSVAFCQGKQAGSTGEVVKQQGRELEFKDKQGKAATKAADQRVDDEVRIAMEEKELNDALQAETDPDMRRLLRGCIILRQQGRDTSSIPGCSRSANRLRAPVPN